MKERNYRVAKVVFPDNKVYFTSRNDNRTPVEFIYDAVSGFNRKEFNRINVESANYRVCYIKNIFEGLSKDESDAKKKTLIEYERSLGTDVINQK
jgi:hypothetical protein